MIDVEGIRRRVDVAVAQAGTDAWVLAFDANGIQETVSANGRPLAMRGASEVIKSFDATMREETASIFAGGGRALQVVSRDHVDATIDRHVERFRQRTHGGVLAAAAAPYDPNDAEGSLTSLRAKMAIAKDEAPAPDLDLAQSRAEQCADCGSRRASRDSEKPDAEGERVCERCFEFVRAGRQRARQTEEHWTLESVAAAGKIAVVSADGNDMGAFFASLTDLHALACGSEIVSEIFRTAHERARPDSPHVAPITGGDDIRMFLGPGHLLDYVQKLCAGVRREATSAAGVLDVLPEVARARLRDLAVGVGAVVADHHMPAARLVELAHALETSAKRAGRTHGESTFDFALLTSGGEMTQGAPERKDERKDERTRPLLVAALPEALRHADALRKVPKTQRSRLLEMASGSVDEAEYLNLLRYQLARSRAWQDWYHACGVDWRDPDAVAAHRPDRGMVELAALLAMAT